MTESDKLVKKSYKLVKKKSQKRQTSEKNSQKVVKKKSDKKCHSSQKKLQTSKKVTESDRLDKKSQKPV